MFEDSISIDDNVILKAIRHPIKYELPYSLLRKVETKADEFFSKDSSIWKTGIIQQAPPAFHKEFPRKATSLDNDEIYIDMNDDFLIRWLPQSVLKVVFPAIYFQELISTMKKQRKVQKNDKVSVEFYGSHVPTNNEKEKCNELNGKGYWTRTGTWFCTCQNISPNKSRDNFGAYFFQTYNEWLIWNQSMTEISESARREENFELLSKIGKAKYSNHLS